MGMMGGQDMGMGMGMGMERVFPCVRLRGLPFDVTEDEIRIFLGCEPVDILLVKRDGRFSGEAFVVLGSPLQIQMAVDKNKSYMGRRYVEVFRAKKLDYYKAVMAEMYVDGAGMRGGGGGAGGFRQGGGGGGAAYGGGFGSQGGFSNGARGMDPAAGGGAGNGYDAGPSNVLRLRGLPFSAQKEDIVRWFEDCQITPLLPDNVHIITDYGRPTGVALVEFASPQDAQAAGAKDKQMMGTRYIEVFASSRDELQRYLPRSY
jgi:heterogeneous nuclear ribonucleoprotein F/H